MLDDAEQRYTSEEFLHITTECGQEEARRLLRICENDLELALLLFFAEKVEVKVENEIKINVDVEPENYLSTSDEVEKDENGALPSRAKKDNVVSKLQRELKIEAVVINVSASHPAMDIDHIRSLVQDYDGNESLVRDFLNQSEMILQKPSQIRKDEMKTNQNITVYSEVKAVPDGYVYLEHTLCKPIQVGKETCKSQLAENHKTSQEPGPKILTQDKDIAIDECGVDYSAVPKHCPCPKQLWERVVGLLVLVGVCILILLLFCYAYDSEIITSGN